MDAVGLAEHPLILDGIDPERASPGRIYDFWLGGTQNFAADRAADRRAALDMPTLTAAIRANRAFLGRVVRHLAAERGIAQFLDLGSGVPAVGNVHEVARAVNGAARVVYVDRDPVAIARSRHLLAGVPGVAAILADLREPASVWEHPLVPDTLDPDRPVAVLCTAVLHFLSDAEQPDRILRNYLDAVVPGSYLALSHAAPDLTRRHEQEAMLVEYRRATGSTFTNREPEVIAGWLERAGLEVCAPGLVTVDRWLPEPGTEQAEMLRTYGVLARKQGPAAAAAGP